MPEHRLQRTREAYAVTPWDRSAPIPTLLEDFARQWAKEMSSEFRAWTDEYGHTHLARLPQTFTVR